MLFNMGQLCLKELEAMHLAQFKNSQIFLHSALRAIFCE